MPNRQQSVHRRNWATLKVTDLGNITLHTLVTTSATCWYRWSVLALAVRQKDAVLRPEWYSDTRHWCQLVWMWMLIWFDLNFSKSARTCNVTFMFWISLERYVVRAFSVAFKPFGKRDHPCPSRLPLRAHFHRERDVWLRGSPWNVWFFLAFLRIFCKNFETFDIYELRQTHTAFMVKCVIVIFDPPSSNSQISEPILPTSRLLSNG